MIPWERLGLSRVLALDEEDAVVTVDGVPRPDAAPPSGPLPELRYGGEEDGTAIDLRSLARTLFPTLADHSLSAVAAHVGLAASGRPPRETIACLLPPLIDEALSLDPGVLSLLGELLPPPTGSLLLSLVPFARPRPPAPDLRPAASPVPPHTLEEAWSAEGPIARRLSSFESRPGQVDMAERVRDALEEGGTLLVEAGPGTGKTFAYLVPALLLLRDGKLQRLVVSTRTKTLQEQLFRKDLPFLVRALCPGLQVALLKGRENYLCLRRWQELLGELATSLEADLLPALAPIGRWLFETESGDIDENQAFLSDPRSRVLWPLLRDDPRHCSAPACPFAATDCYSLLARRRAREASLAVVNHALLLADARAGGVVLGNYEHLVADEAHALEGAARQAFTQVLSQRSVDLLLADVEPAHRPPGWLGRAATAPDAPTVQRARDLISALRGMNSRLFAALDRALPTEARGRTPPLPALAPEAARLSASLRTLRTELEGIAASLPDEETRRQADGLLMALDEVAGIAASLFLPAPSGRVHWYERDQGESVLFSSPLEIGGLLADALYTRLEGVVLTSATLSLDGSFDYAVETLGLEATPGTRDVAIVASAFSYQDRMRAYFADFLPPVEASAEEYAVDLATLLRTVAETSNRKVLALFTSYRLLHAVRERLAGSTEVLSQGVDGPRSKVIERFRAREGGALLLGTDSFWEGVDLPGRDLEILVVTRLPFPVPTDPILSALGEALEQRGRDAFLDLSLPQALLRLRQGAGRLIRTQTDRGALIITDRRILTKSYGPRFAAALPVPGRRISTLSDLLLDLEAWFG